MEPLTKEQFLRDVALMAATHSEKELRDAPGLYGCKDYAQACKRAAYIGTWTSNTPGAIKPNYYWNEHKAWVTHLHHRSLGTVPSDSET
jgi:hypothetical protein